MLDIMVGKLDEEQFPLTSCLSFLERHALHFSTGPSPARSSQDTIRSEWRYSVAMKLLLTFCIS